MRIRKTSQYVEGGISIETGSNANGSYIKYSNGTLICYGTATTSDAWVSVNFPVTFIANPTVTTGGNSGTAETTTIMIIKTANIGTSSFRTCRIVGSNYDAGKVDWIAIGKWK